MIFHSKRLLELGLQRVEEFEPNTASAFPAACCGVSERSKIEIPLEVEDSLQLAAGSFNAAQNRRMLGLMARGAMRADFKGLLMPRHEAPGHPRWGRVYKVAAARMYCEWLPNTVSALFTSGRLPFRLLAIVPDDQGRTPPGRVLKAFIHAG